MWAYLLISILVITAYWIFKNSQYLKFEVDNDNYQVEKQSPNRTEALSALVNIRKNLDRLVHHLTKKYPNEPLVQRLNYRFKDTVLREANPEGDPNQTSYTINKGDTMVICLRTNDKKMVDFNTLMYVAIHELSHIYSSSYHHNDEFWGNMKFMIDEAIEAGIYRQVDYNKNPVRYCGMTIASDIPSKAKIFPPSATIQQRGGAIPLIEQLLAKSSVIFVN